MKRLFTIALVLLACGAAFGAQPAVKIRTLKVLVVIYRGEEGTTNYYTDTEAAGIKAGTEIGRLFYFRNTNCRLHLDFTHLVINTPAPDNSGPTYTNIEADLRKRGVKDGQYDGIFSTGHNFSGNYGGFEVFGRSGAAFAGAGKGGPLGTFPDTDPNIWYDVGWMTIHEFQHALDYPICELSGHPEMLSDHPYSDSYAKYFWYGHHAGMHWDWVAHCLSSFKNYLDVKATTDTVYEAVDADGDGLPDNDPKLPMDEKRFGSDSTKKDTDSDGLTDLQEFSADIYHGSSPRKTDTDGDGIPDGKDLNPTVALAPTVAFSDKSPVVDGKLDKQYKQLTFGTYMDMNPELAKARVYACWNEDALSLLVKSAVKCNMSLYVDTSAKNGFWEGGDTYLISITSDGTVELSGLNLSGKVAGGKAVWGADGLEVIIPVMLGQGISGEINYGGPRRPQDVADGMVLFADRWVSFNMSLSNEAGKVLITPQWTMFDTKLAKSPKDPPRPSLRFTKRIASATNPVVNVVGVSLSQEVSIVDSGGKVLGKRWGSGDLKLTGKLKTGTDARSGANILYAVSKGRKSAPVTITVDAKALAPTLRRAAGSTQISIAGEPLARVDIFAVLAKERPRAVATVTLDKDGKGSFDASSLGSGFVGGYAKGMAFERTEFWRVDRTLKFDFNDGSPAAGLPNEGFCARWLGFIDLPNDGTYTFYVTSDDGARLWVRGQLVVDNWGHHDAKEVIGEVTLDAGQYPIRLDYYEEYGWASLHLQWSGPGIQKTYDLPVSPLPGDMDSPVIYAKQIDQAGNASDFSDKMSVPL